MAMEVFLYDFVVSCLLTIALFQNLVQAVSEGQALSEYQPWRDGTTVPSQGNLKTLHEIRQTVMDPWPEEISRAKDECTRILHRMREQLNIVINLQSKSREHVLFAPPFCSRAIFVNHPFFF